MLEFIDIDQFFPYLQTELMECPEPIMVNHVRGAAIDLCQHAAVWRHVCSPMTVSEGIKEYELDRPSKDSLVHSVIGAWLGNNPLHSASHTDLARQPGLNANRESVGTFAYDVSERGFVTLFGSPRVNPNSQLMFTVSLKPSRTSDAVPAQLYNDYHDCIINGALARALCMLKRPWSDPQMAQKYDLKFERGKALARMAIDRGNVTGPQKLKHRQFVSNHRYV